MLFLCQGLGTAGAKSGHYKAQASADDVAKAYEVLLAHGFKDVQIQQAMQVLSQIPFGVHRDIDAMGAPIYDQP